MCKNTSLPPVSGAMKPKPFVVNTWLIIYLKLHFAFCRILMTIGPDGKQLKNTLGARVFVDFNPSVKQLRAC